MKSINVKVAALEELVQKLKRENRDTSNTTADVSSAGSDHSNNYNDRHGSGHSPPSTLSTCTISSTAAPLSVLSDVAGLSCYDAVRNIDRPMYSNQFSKSRDSSLGYRASSHTTEDMPRRYES